MRHWCCDFWPTSLHIAHPLPWGRPSSPTDRPSHWLRNVGMRPLQAHCHYGLGTVYATTGQREQAHTALSTAIEMYRAMEMTFWLPQTEAALAQVEGHLERGTRSSGLGVLPFAQ